MDINVVPAPDDLAYRVDANARITFVNDCWDDFARDNGAPELTGAAVIGRLMSEFISGAETWHLYGLLTRHAQRVSRPFSLRFRCDAPHAQRFMPELLEKIGNGELRPETIITHRLPLADAARGYQVFNSQDEECRKVVLTP